MRGPVKALRRSRAHIVAATVSVAVTAADAAADKPAACRYGTPAITELDTAITVLT